MVRYLLFVKLSCVGQSWKTCEGVPLLDETGITILSNEFSGFSYLIPQFKSENPCVAYVYNPCHHRDARARVRGCRVVCQKVPELIHTTDTVAIHGFLLLSG